MHVQYFRILFAQYAFYEYSCFTVAVYLLCRLCYVQGYGCMVIKFSLCYVQDYGCMVVKFSLSTV